ncbi:phosphorothioated DNA-binding restriction endonuclease [Paludisphaera rhizosphaerae]|uniref:phosphorothioated DNA-binding restriction endonuclease n=1 Tax=Paludisphaera rhizosphaerae TaxID=2711216 RepID=UPI0013EC0A61|nr:HNH endonuclease [Paludisphaera rhizosphaerae]
MSDEAVLKRFDELGIWRQGGQRAPHKPLLVLYALGRWQAGQKDVGFRQVETDLTALLREFGPSRKRDLPEQPFWRLQRDGVWAVHAPSGIAMKTGDDIPRATALRSNDVRAEFTADVQAALSADSGLAASIAVRVLEQHFPESLHPDILNAVGLSLETAVTKRKRDPAFRQKVLKAYEYRCAVCGFDLRIGATSIALDAAHIRWHQAGGPETEDNGLALCVLHHKTFDLGAFTVQDGLLLVSDQANGSTGFQEALMAYHGKPIRTAQRPDWTPHPEHLGWHGREVFKGEARHVLREKRMNRIY